jgi:hypothetical protein
MLMQYISVICVLGVVIVGVLVIVQVVSLKDLGNGILRGLLMVVLTLVAFCVMKGFLLPILTSSLVRLKQMISCVVIIVLARIAVMVVWRILVSKFAKWLSAEGKQNKGDL